MLYNVHSLKGVYRITDEENKFLDILLKYQLTILIVNKQRYINPLGL
jgi:hypothetical protein